ncbi:zinc ribbon domain-containing protein [Sphingobium sp.]|uniref:zinc ribbon domain-containing protein n=1 Tax=Sphingobium sp. TaxID=1912891 RepID=UPI0039C9D648
MLGAAQFITCNEIRFSVKNTHGDPLRFAFTGLITCGHCGCAVVAQMQKKRYVHYHCSGFR